MVVIKCPELEILDKNTLVKFSGLGEKLLWAWKNEHIYLIYVV